MEGEEFDRRSTGFVEGEMQLISIWSVGFVEGNMELICGL